MLKRFAALAVSAAALAIATTGAQAAPAFTAGSFAVSLDPSTSELTTTSVTNTPLIITLSSPGEFDFGSGTGSFAGLTDIGIALNGGTTLNFTVAADFSFSSTTFGNFTASTVTQNGAGCGSSGPNAACYTVAGMFTPGSDFSTHTAVTADEIWTLNQSGGAGNAISLSATFHAPEISVPEPLTISLFGAGLAGLGFSARRRKAAPKA